MLLAAPEPAPHDERVSRANRSRMAQAHRYYARLMRRRPPGADAKPGRQHLIGADADLDLASRSSGQPAIGIIVRRAS
jgi:hypothetical protein